MTAPAVLKFGGSTFPALTAYTDLAAALRRRAEEERRPMAVVVSAMPGETEKLRGLLHEANPEPEDATVAGLLTLADTVSAHLLATALHRVGLTATVLAGHQQGLVTDSTFMWAKVKHLDPQPLRRALDDHQVVIVPGGQAADAQGRPTWLGKNSSDLSAVLVAAALGADRVEIHSDVDGIYSADPNVVNGARLLPEVTYDTAALMSLYGAKVLHRRSVRTAKQHGITLVCRHNRPPFPAGTVISGKGAPAAGVVANTRSKVLAYATAAEADLAHSVFHAEGIDTVRIEDGPHLVVVGGYLDIDRFQRVHGLPQARVVGIPVTEITGSRATTHIADDAEQARQLAQKLHDALPEPEPAVRLRTL
ncbi:aspartate kinase [Streptomyces thermoalcalitolerans]|uniref:aspartate kinase n=1 Tax=Streptomyces thermoalcalitolerans TaxID=65605 RepID=A0ABP3ZBZ4_9ACTN